jgi:hypothetical protein
LLVVGCGGSSGGGSAPRPSDRQALSAYVGRIELVRHGVNKLLDGADPILGGYREGRLSAPAAQRGLRRIEHRFAHYEAGVAAVRPIPPDLVAAQRAYAHTYVLADAYLRALIAAVPGRRWNRLPQFEARQRRVIVAWRNALALEAARVEVPLPNDIQIAGSGDITPSPLGES